MAETDQKTMINRITMQGFKSFNRRVNVPLLRGFNVVCGPNGVGKSNIVDAICFVLGRTSAKSMRADRLHELIFHGAEGKGGASQAIVTLYLDNIGRSFNFDDDEISVTRKVNKKGVSVYKLNGRTTTRQKILELLSSARIYPDGHNIVLQGDITQIIEMNPIQRRGIVDEISGIADYKDKKEKANRDLQVVDQKLREAEIVITERFERFKRLENERNAALRFQDLQKRLALLRASLANKKAQNFEEKLEKMNEDTQKKQQQINQVDASIEKIEADINERDEAMRDVADRLLEMSKHVDEEKKVSEIRSNILIHENDIEACQREIERLTLLIDKLEVLNSKKTEFTDQIPRAVQAVLKQNFRGVHGALRELIKIPDKYGVAIEIAAGRHLNDIVVENDDVASFCIDFLKREKIGRCAFIPLNKIKPNLFKNNSLLSRPDVVGVASRLIKYDMKYMRAMEFVFGTTLIVKDLEAARALGVGKERMVTLEGDLIERSGAMIGGYFFREHPKTVTKSLEGEIETYRQQRKKLEKELTVLNGELDELKKQLNKYAKSETTRQMIDMEKIKISSEHEMDDLRAKRKQTYERRMRLQTELNKVSIQKAKVEAEMENARIELSQYGEMEYIDETVAALQKFLYKASEELNSLGPINMRAIEEYDMFRSQFDEYKKKYEKILEEKNAVVAMIEEIEQKRMEVFYNCLKIISTHFANAFKRMTGGTASLELEDPSNLESGLLISANPQGKKMLNIDSMSGGEKTLTALAFIFAIQKYKPAPFYILDEVDAALDKENSQKIAELIQALSKDEQFVVITHNDQTIKAGDRVYGMTMDRGESKILGVELPA